MDDQDNTTQQLENLPVLQEMAKQYSLTATALLFTVRSVAIDRKVNPTDAELLSCLMVAKEHGLNPLTKEIYFMKTKSGHLQPIVSVDGWIKKCNMHPQFDGLEFSDLLDDGQLKAIRCTIYRKDRSHPTSVTEYLEECKGSGGPWQSHPSRMLRHKSLIQCARIAFGFAGVMDPDEYHTWQTTIDVTPGTIPEPETPAFVDIEDEMERDDTPSTGFGANLDPFCPRDAPAGMVAVSGDKFLTYYDAVEEFRADIVMCDNMDDCDAVMDAWRPTLQGLPLPHSDTVGEIYTEATEKFREAA